MRTIDKRLSLIESINGSGDYNEINKAQSNKEGCQRFLKRWWTQFQALITKNMIIHRRWWKSSLLLIIMPTLFLLLLRLCVSWMVPFNPVSNDLKLTLSHCSQYDVFGEEVKNRQPACITLMFAPLLPIATDIMREVAHENNLEFEVDVVGKSTKQDVARHILTNPGLVETAVIFKNDDPSNLQYQIWYNQTLVDNGKKYLFRSGPWNNIPTKFKTVLLATINSAIVSYNHKNNKNMSHSMSSISLFSQSVKGTLEFLPPYVKSSTNRANFDANDRDMLLSLFATGFFVVGVNAVGIIVSHFIVYEKKHKLVGSMRMMGLIESAHWMSWLFIECLLLIPSSLLMPLVGLALDLTIYRRTDFGVQFILLFVFAISTVACSFFLFSIITSSRWVNGMNFLWISSSFAIAFILSLMLRNNMYILWSPQTPSFIVFLVSIHPAIHYSKCVDDIYRKIFPQNGPPIPISKYTYSFSDLYHSEKIGSGDSSYYAKSTNYNLCMMLLLSFIYLILAWYLAQVFSGKQGGSKPFYFPFLPSYWGFSFQAEPIPEDTIGQKQKESKIKQSIVLHKLSKAFKKNTAVKELSMTMIRGEIFVLLGHNGAGKSTTLHMLTGLYAPTHGYGFIFGKNIATESDHIRSMTGICPQDNILWDQLTATEHLRLYAAFKGIPSDRRQFEVDKQLDTFRLTHVKGPAGSYSGGMKRRLLIAMSAIGKPRMIMLDEPTTGMDPLNRRYTWQAIQRLKKNMIVILTTHSMEEADALADQIAIMADGKLRALGSSLFLKNRFGSGYQITLLTETEDMSKVEGILLELIPNANIIDSVAGNITLGIPLKSKRFVGKFFHWIETSTNKHLVKEWTISDSTLEEVFLRLAKQNQGINEIAVDFSEEEKVCKICQLRPANAVTLYTAPNEDGVPVQTDNVICMACALKEQSEDLDEKEIQVSVDHTIKEVTQEGKNDSQLHGNDTIQIDNELVKDNVSAKIFDPNDVQPTSNFTQIVAVVFNSMLVLKTSKRYMCCNVCFLVVALLLASFLFPKQSSPLKICPGGWVTNSDCDIENMYNAFIFKSEFKPESVLKISCVRFDPIDKHCLERRKMATPQRLRTGRDWPTDLDVWPKYTSSLIWYVDDTQGTPLSSWNLFGLGRGNLSAPGIADFINFENSSETNANSISDFVIASQKLIKSKKKDIRSKNCIDEYYNWITDGYWIEANSTTAVIEHRKLFPDYGIVFLNNDPSNFAVEFKILVYREIPWDENYLRILFSDDLSSCDNVELQNSDYDDHISLIHGIAEGLLRTSLNNSTASIEPEFVSFPEFNFENYRISMEDIIFPVLLTLILTTTFFPQFTAGLVREREEKLLYMMRISGLKFWPYWCGKYLYFSLVFFIWSTLYILVGYFSSSGVFVNANPSLYVALLVVWNHAQNSIAIFLSTIFTKTSLATGFCYFYLLALIIITMIINSNDHDVSSYLFCIPPVAYGRATTLIMMYGGSSIIPGSPLSIAIGLLFGISSIFLMIGLFFSYRTFKNQGSLFTAIRKLGYCCSASVSKERASVPLVTGKHEHEDKDVVNERLRVQNMDKNTYHKSGIFMENLKKVYTGKKKKVAVNNMTLAMNYNECFGLLGPNGAGKTTCLSMLTGLLPITKGSARIGGLDIKSNVDAIYRILGVCPQFDIVWSELTVQEHLALYSRIKGINSSEARGKIQQAAERCGLDGDVFNMPAGELSGGNKRRLSIAISLIGNPWIWLLDEPTTGLDPQTRRQIWGIVKSLATKDRCTVLTTHSMEEADTLCTRIGIMALGELQCVGSQVHLKNRFGEGYKLTINLAQQDEKKYVGPDYSTKVEPLQEFIDSICPTNHLVHSFGKSKCYMLPKQSVTLSGLFAILERNKTKYGIREWGLTQTSLEEVFVKIVKDAEEKRPDAENI